METTLYQGDCLEIMQQIPDKSVDMVLCDLPYGTTACKWDVVIPFEPLWEYYKRVAKDNAAIVLFASQPFTTDMANSNRKWFRYEWVWEKTIATGFGNCNRMPMKQHENILVFYKKLPTYNPQFTPGQPYTDKRNVTHRSGEAILNANSSLSKKIPIINEGKRYPTSVIRFSNANNDTDHPTQKPVPLLEYLIKTYTNEGDLVLDNTMGSGSTGVACRHTNRRFIGIEKDPHYFEIAKKRIEATGYQTNLFNTIGA